MAIPFNCPTCPDVRLELEEPKFELLNSQRAIVAVANNAAGVECPTCGAYFKVVAAAMPAPSWQVVEVEKPADASRILLPPGSGGL